MDIEDVKFCRLKPGKFCSEHFCNRCFIWVKWDVVLQEAMDTVERINKQKGGDHGPALPSS